MALGRQLIGLQISLEMPLVPRHPQTTVGLLFPAGLQACRRTLIIQILRLETGPTLRIPTYNGAATRHLSELT
jgi:hypothetical protein